MLRCQEPVSHSRSAPGPASRLTGWGLGKRREEGPPTPTPIHRLFRQELGHQSNPDLRIRILSFRLIGE